MADSTNTVSDRKLAMVGLALGIAAIVGQYVAFQPLFKQIGLGPVSSVFGMLMFLTILTNLAMIAAYGSSLVNRPRMISGFFARPGVRTAIAAHITLVATVYLTAIRGQLELTLPMAITDALLHYVAPVIYLAWWWLLPGKQALSYTAIPAWMAWPVIYLTVIMMAGLSSGTFIYPLLDVTRLGPAQVTLNIMTMLAVLAVICTVLVFLAKAQSGEPDTPPDRG